MTAAAAIVPAYAQSLIDLFDSVRRVGNGYSRLTEAGNPGATETLRTWAARYGYACEEATDDRLGMIELTVRVPAHGTIVVSRPSERGSVRSSAVLTTDPVLMSLLESQRKVMDALAATEDEDAAARERLRDLGLGLGQEIGRRTIKVAVERGV